MNQADSRLILALDLPGVDAARAMADAVGDAVSFHKIGLQLIPIGGMALAQELKAQGKSVFLDFKLLDIAATVEKATRSLAGIGADLLTVHAEPEAMKAAVKGRGDSDLKLLGVTVLTSYDDAALAEIARPVPVCADESCHDRASLPDLAGKYHVINIKLDKTGGLTEALALRDAARAEGFDVMVGCMVGSSLAMAPATLVAQGAKVVDLDGPLLLAEDRDNALKFDGAGVHPPVAALWG
jgi:L-alanine-DL-glutamate epimerase-like enolase superfamily enzyme